MYSFTNLALLASAFALCQAAPHAGEDLQWKRAPVSSSTAAASCTDAVCVLSEALASYSTTTGSTASTGTVASTNTVSQTPTSASITSSAAVTSYPCYHIADPDSGQTGPGGCECSGYTNTFSVMPSTGAGAVTGSAYQPCAYTSIPPLPSATGTPTTAPSSSAVSNALPTQCTDGANPDASCFNALDLPDYLLHWWTANQASCGQQGFAACFYAKNTKYAPSDCGQLNNDAACTEPVWNDFVGTTNGPENFYVAWNIWSVSSYSQLSVSTNMPRRNTNGFFLDLYNAIGTAEGSASAGISAIVALLDPPTNQNIVLNDVLDALTFGLALYAEGSILVKALLRSMPQTAGLLGKLFPSGTVDGEYQDWAKVSSDLGKVTDAFRSSVAEGLPLVENDVNAFITWSQNSGFSGFRPSLNGIVDSMTMTLNTYCIAQIISSQGIVVSRAANTDVHALQTNGSQLNWNTGCSGGYTAGICDTFFWDGTDTYGLTDPENMDKSYHDELTSFFVGTPALTTGQLLFTGAQACYTATQKNGGSSPSIDSTDPSSFSCLSSMQVCTWLETDYGPFDASCANLPSKNAVLPGFGVSGCIGSTDSTTSIDVPRAYLGPGVYQDAKNIEDLQVDSFCDNISYKRRRWAA